MNRPRDEKETTRPAISRLRSLVRLRTRTRRGARLLSRQTRHTGKRYRKFLRFVKQRNVRKREHLAIFPPRILARPTYRWTLRFVPDRYELARALEARGYTGKGAEIGVREGRYSEVLLGKWSCALLLSVDPWRAECVDLYAESSNVSQDRHDDLRVRTGRRLERFGDRSEIWAMNSIAAASAVADADLDFVYIDARHDRESVLEDLSAWYPKVRGRGIIAGHNYSNEVTPSGEWEVKGAVNDFFRQRGLRVRSTRERARDARSWIVEVPPGGVER